MSLRLTYAADQYVEKSTVRDALAGLDADDLSESSPVTSGGTELAISMTTHEGSRAVVITEEGNHGEWTKTSEVAVKQAVESVSGIEKLREESGGYTSDE